MPIPPLLQAILATGAAPPDDGPPQMPVFQPWSPRRPLPEGMVGPVASGYSLPEGAAGPQTPGYGLADSGVGPPAPPSVLPDPFSGPGGYHPVRDIMEIRGGNNVRGVSGYGMGQPSNYNIWQGKLGQYQANQDAMKNRAVMIQAQAAADQVGIQRAQMTPEYMARQLSGGLLSNPNANLTPQERAMHLANMGIQSPPPSIGGAFAQTPGAPPVTTDAATAKLVAQGMGNLDPNSAKGEEFFNQDAITNAKRLAGEPLGVGEIEIPGTPTRGAFALGDIKGVGLGYLGRNIASLLTSGQLAQTPRQEAEQHVGAMLPQGYKGQKPGVRLRQMQMLRGMEEMAKNAPPSTTPVSDRTEARVKRSNQDFESFATNLQ